MNQEFSLILTVNFKHEYFEDGFFRPIEISYAKDTMKLMRDLEIIIKPFLGGFHLLTARPELLAANSDDNPLQLYLSCKDPYYINYSVLPTYKPSSSLIYFNNLNVNSIGDDGELKLHDEPYVSEENVLRLTHGEFTFDSFDSNKTYTFKHATEDLISDQYIAKELPDSNNINISNIPRGIVRVFDGDTLVNSVYYYPKAIWKKPLGTIEIFTKTLSQHCQITKNKAEDKIDFVKADYSINFNSRKTIWKYFLISEEYQKFSNLTIINSAREQIFEAEKVNDESLVLTSIQTLPLTEHPIDTFQLVDNFHPDQRLEIVVLKHLVKPSPEQLFHDDKETEDILYSHIYL